MTIWQCGTCNYETSDVVELACGMWTHCSHYSAAKAAGTLPPAVERPGSPVPYE